jgi:hypothetical protein
MIIIKEIFEQFPEDKATANIEDVSFVFSDINKTWYHDGVPESYSWDHEHYSVNTYHFVSIKKTLMDEKQWWGKFK